MNSKTFMSMQPTENANFDLFRLSKSKQVVDLAPNTIRALNRKGLPIYRNGRIAFVSKSELEAFLKSK